MKTIAYIRHRIRNRDRRRRERAINRARGLRHDGRPRKLKCWPQLHGLPAKIAKVRRQKLSRDERVAAGFTINGDHRKNYQWPELNGLSPAERQRERIRICLNKYRHSRATTGLASLIKNFRDGNKTVIGKLKGAA